jgi:hypothetical protein
LTFVGFNTLVSGQQALELDARLIAAELNDPDAIRALAAAIARDAPGEAHARARELLERSI